MAAETLDHRRQVARFLAAERTRLHLAGGVIQRNILGLAVGDARVQKLFLRLREQKGQVWEEQHRPALQRRHGARLQTRLIGPRPTVECQAFKHKVFQA